MIPIKGVHAIVTDIEGTTGSIAFVHEILFPYARAHLPGFVVRHRDALADLLDAAREAEGAPDLDEQAVVALLLRWIDEDRKASPLKLLQGMIWREGYESGELVGHVYDDAAAMLHRWRARGLSLNVYSSGSVEAQKLIFGHSTAGDLTPLFDAYFDTAIGAKTSAGSYARIAAALAVDPPAILFLSDAPAEIAAARQAGMQAIRLVRDSAAAPGEAARFDEIEVEG